MPEVYGVFEGGGVRGTALVGAVAAAEEKGITFRAVAGTSAGAIVASLVAAGYNAAEMRTLLTMTNFRDFKDPVSLFQRLQPWGLLGLYKGEFFRRWIGEQISLKVKGHRHEPTYFRDLPKPLTVVAADVVHRERKIFSSRRFPDLLVADAVRASMSIPFFFRPMPFGTELLVDGGVVSNFPAWVFEEEQRSAPLPILGLRLQPEDVPPPKIRNMLDLAKAVVLTMMKTSLQFQTAHVPNLYTIELPTAGVQTTDFDISESDKDRLYNEGYRTALAELTIRPVPALTPS